MQASFYDDVTNGALSPDWHETVMEFNKSWECRNCLTRKRPTRTRIRTTLGPGCCSWIERYPCIQGSEGGHGIMLSTFDAAKHNTNTHTHRRTRNVCARRGHLLILRNIVETGRHCPMAAMAASPLAHWLQMSAQHLTCGDIYALPYTIYRHRLHSDSAKCGILTV